MKPTIMPEDMAQKLADLAKEFGYYIRKLDLVHYSPPDEFLIKIRNKIHTYEPVEK
jgi:hypothetical protein